MVIVAGQRNLVRRQRRLVCPEHLGPQMAIFSVAPPVVDATIVGAAGYAPVRRDALRDIEPAWSDRRRSASWRTKWGICSACPICTTPTCSSSGIGNWSLMSCGSWNRVTRAGDSPSLLDAWSKGVLGFVTPTQVSGTLPNQSLPAAATSSTVYQFLAGSPSAAPASTSCWRIGSRPATTSDCLRRGCLIWHIDESRPSNSHECIPGGSPACSSTIHYKVALIQADNLFHLEHATNSGDGGDPFPGTTNKVSWTGATAPNSNLWSGAATTISVSAISASSSTMTATLSLGGAAPILSVTPLSVSFGIHVGRDTDRSGFHRVEHRWWHPHRRGRRPVRHSVSSPAEVTACRPEPASS